MNYKNLPEYQDWKDQIESLLLEDYPLRKRDSVPNSFEECPEITPLDQLNRACKEVSDVIGEKNWFVKVLGFLKTNEGIASNRTPLVCVCDCGRYCLIKHNTYQRNKRIFACSECVFKIDSYEYAFAKRHGYKIDQVALSSIFGNADANPTKLFSGSTADDFVTANPFERFSLDELKGLVTQYNALSIEVFQLAEDKNRLYSPKRDADGKKMLPNCFVKRPEMLDLDDIPKRYHNRNITQIVGAKIYRFQVMGVLSTNQGYASLTTKDVAFVLRCDCGMYSIMKYKPIHEKKVKCCVRCSLVENEVHRRKYKESEQILTFEQAWGYLGVKFAEHQALYTSVQSDLSNSYYFERKRYERDDVDPKFARFFDQRFGFVVVTDKARRNDKGERFLVAKCDCGLECVFEYKVFSNPVEKRVLMCSQCSYQVDQALRREFVPHIACKSSKQFDSAWAFYLKYFDYPSDIEFAPIWKAYLILKQKKPDLVFKSIVGAIIEAAVKQKARTLGSAPVLKVLENGVE